MDQEAHKDLVKNRRAYHDFEILETFEAGIVLQGTEIKSLRDGGGGLTDCYVRPVENELWLLGSRIAPYRFGNIHNHEEVRDRKLLMHKREIKKIKVAIQEKGLTIVPLAMYLKRGKVKVAIGIGRGKKLHDKREALKAKDQKRMMEREE